MKKKHVLKNYTFDFDFLDEIEAKFILEMQFRQMAGYKLNLDNPVTFNEKIQWIKLYYRDDLMTFCTDKVTARNYIEKKIGKEYLIPCFGVYERPENINFNNFPEKYVIKVNWGSGQNIICSNNNLLDKNKAISQLTYWMLQENNHYYDFLEWSYKNIMPKIIVEEFIENVGDLKDYKFFCYSGEPLYMFIAQNRARGHSAMTLDFYDMSFRHLPFTRLYPNAKTPPVKPEKWDEMVEVSKILSEPFPFVRVDFYEVFGKLKVGELTFYPGNGTERFTPFIWDQILGNKLTLPKKMPYPISKVL